METTLFLCTGNYYRSRFAEAVFNFEARRRGIGRRAVSAGLALERLDAQGPLSPWADRVLRAMHIPLSDTGPVPRAVQPDDFATAARVIALYEEEHRPLLEQNFPEWLPVVEFWNIGDLGEMDPAAALPEIARRVNLLLES